MRFDSTRFDAIIHLASDRRKGIWATQALLNRGRAIRTAGQMRTEASAHSLLSVALLNSLTNVTRAQATELVRIAEADIIKPRFQIICQEQTFLPSLQERMKGQQLTPNRSARHILMQLPKQLARFTFDFVTDPEDSICYSLKNWAHRTVYDRKLIDTIPPALAGTVSASLSLD